MKTLKIIYISALCSAAAASVFAAKDISPKAFPSGGTVCYVGDSITHMILIYFLVFDIEFSTFQI